MNDELDFNSTSTPRPKMNTPSPLIPQGSLQGLSRTKSNVRIAVFTVIAIHAVFFSGLLLQGCRRDKEKTQTGASTNQITTNANILPPLPTNYYSDYNQLTSQLQNVEPPPLPGSWAARTNTTTGSLSANSNIVQIPGDTGVRNPNPSGTASEAPTGTQPYKIAANDKLFDIAKKFGVSPAAIQQANPGLNPRRMKVGQTIQIPSKESGSAPSTAADSNNRGASATPPSAPPASEASAASGTVHVVKPGENLKKIATHYGVTVKALKEVNKLRSDRILVNQKLKIPAAARAAGSTNSHGT